MKLSVAIIFLVFTLKTFAQQPTKEQIKQVEDAKKEVKSMKGKPFPEFTLTTLSGDTISSKDTNGKIILFNFWFTSCGPCIKEMPELNDLVKEFKSEDVLFIAPTFSNSAQVNSFLKRFDFDYQIVSDVKDFCLELNIRNYLLILFLTKKES